MDNAKDDSYYLSKIFGNVNKILEYMQNVSEEDFRNNDELIDAVCFRIIQIHENFNKVSDKFKVKNPEINYSDIRGFRNRIVHEYGNVDYHIVYETATDDIYVLHHQLGKVLNK